MDRSKSARFPVFAARTLSVHHPWSTAVVSHSSQNRLEWGDPSLVREPGLTAWLVFAQLGHGSEQVFGLGQNGVFQFRLVGDKGVHGGYPFDGGVQVVE